MKNKVSFALLLAMMGIILSSCGFGRVGECREKYVGCHWNCELQYGWTGYHGREHDELILKAAAESCYWQERPSYRQQRSYRNNHSSRSSPQLVPDYCFDSDGNFICNPNEYSDLLRYDDEQT